MPTSLRALSASRRGWARPTSAKRVALACLSSLVWPAAFRAQAAWPSRGTRMPAGWRGSS
eukprot:jgi/Astpho2/6434/e_gw1.00094.18.1_t